jgi:hypothetical protein
MLSRAGIVMLVGIILWCKYPQDRPPVSDELAGIPDDPLHQYIKQIRKIEKKQQLSPEDLVKLIKRYIRLRKICKNTPPEMILKSKFRYMLQKHIIISNIARYCRRLLSQGYEDTSYYGLLGDIFYQKTFDHTLRLIKVPQPHNYKRNYFTHLLAHIAVLLYQKAGRGGERVRHLKDFLKENSKRLKRPVYLAEFTITTAEKHLRIAIELTRNIIRDRPLSFDKHIQRDFDKAYLHFIFVAETTPFASFKQKTKFTYFEKDFWHIFEEE